MTIADDLREQYRRRQLASQALSRCVSLAQSVGVLADQGKRYTIPESVSNIFIGSIQIGEYVQTGKIPSASLVRDVLEVVQ